MRNQELERLLAERTAEVEAARRATEIEVALERVRVRTMAMHHSDELADASVLVFQELKKLGIAPRRCGLAIKQAEGPVWQFWHTTNQGQAIEKVGRLAEEQVPFFADVFAAWRQREAASFTRTFAGDELDQVIHLLIERTEVSLPDAEAEVQQGVYPSQVCFNFFFFTHGSLLAHTLHPLEEADRRVLERFAHVFEQTYTRFLDLQKVEAQVREAQIEAALERVRARTMAMHHSDELTSVAEVVFAQFKGLAFPALRRVGIQMMDTEAETMSFWTSAASDQPGIHRVTVPMAEDAKIREIVAGWRAGTPRFAVVFEGQALQDFMAHIIRYGWRYPAEESTPASVVMNFASYSHGLLNAITYDPIAEADFDILERFARVLEQTYTRFLDLKQAEARAREAARQAALDRVRAEIASMRSADDLQRITPLIWRELTTLGVPFFRCGVFIMDEDTEQIQAFLTDPEGSSLTALEIPYDSAPKTQKVVVYWHNKQIYTETWDREQFVEWTETITARGYMAPTAPYQEAKEPPETLALHFAPFAQGMLYVGSTDPLDDEAIDTVKALADAFAVAYARYEDFQRLEAKNREVEAAMADLRATQQQLIHSEKMASLGVLTAGIAHEIKNPLNFINNFAALSRELVDELEATTTPVERQALLADLKASAAKIEAHGRRADDIVRSMMQHAHGGSQQRERVDFNRFVNEYVDLARHGKRAQQPDFNVEILREYDESVGRVAVVPQEMGRVLINLLTNAFDAVAEQALSVSDLYTPQVRIATSRGTGTVKVQVEDNGPGMSEEVKARIFEPFFTTKPTGSGTGLGLSLSYDIVTQGHGGTLTVESDEGQGAAFVVMLPLS
jgi:signal transduction histidine kinase